MTVRHRESVTLRTAAKRWKLGKKSEMGMRESLNVHRVIDGK
jgi:hypothetical protein